ncbi:hypothetical protein [Clostridium sp.]|uniref:hypothetical protein n=1 Tax=Clostridium sp. TaxID=1506 RepID=UPI002FCC3C0B
MNKVLVLSKGTGQAKSFERVMVEHTEKNALNIEWIFSKHGEMGQIIENGDINVVIISPEMMLVEAKIKEELDSKNIPYVVLKPVDFGLKRVDKILPLLEPHFN